MSPLIAALSCFFKDVFPLCDLYYQCHPGSKANGFGFWVHPDFAESVRRYLAPKNLLMIAPYFREISLIDVSQRVLRVFLSWITAVTEAPEDNSTFQFGGLRSPWPNDLVRSIWGMHCSSLLNTLESIHEVCLRRLIEVQLVGNGSYTGVAIESLVAVIMSNLPSFMEEHSSFYGIGCAQNPFLTYVHPCRVRALIEYTGGVTTDGEKRGIERRLCVLSLVDAFIEWICQADIKAIVEKINTLSVPKEAHYYLSNDLLSILGSNMRLKFLSNIQTGVERYLMSIENGFQDTAHQTYATLKYDDSSMTHTYLTQQFESLGIKFLTEVLLVWINSLSKTGVRMGAEQLTRIPRESAGLAATFLMYHRSDENTRTFLYHKACARTEGSRSMRIVNDIFTVAANVHSTKEVNLKSIGSAAI